MGGTPQNSTVIITHTHTHTLVMQAGEAHKQRQEKRSGHQAKPLFLSQTEKAKLTASNLTIVSIFRMDGSMSMLTMMSPAGRERVWEETLGEEQGCVPPLVSTM